MKNLSNILAVSLRSILKNKRRNIFTMIGIIIGISAVITIMALGNGFKKTANDQIASSGASKDAAIVNYMPSGEQTKTNPFKKEDIDVAKQVKGVDQAKIKEDESQGFNAKMTNASKNGDVNIKKEDEMTTPDKGQGYTKDDNDIEEKVVVIDPSIAKKAFHNHALGQTLYIENQGFKVVGVTDDGGGMLGMGDSVHMPTKTFNKYMGDLSQDFPSLEIKLDHGVNKKEVAEKVADKLNKQGSGAGDGQYSYPDMESMMKSMNKLFDGITYFVAAVAGISLFIAGIGVMNVMYISVAERTEEIAIRRAFGAKARDIEFQFLVESIVLCLFGGIIGIILGSLVAMLIDAVTPPMIKSVVSISSVLIAVGVSTLIGIVFGWIPARAAAKKELIDIIK